MGERQGDQGIWARMGGWTPFAVLGGLAIVGACLIVPQVEENRHLAYDLAALRAEKAQVDAQVEANARFAEQIATDPTLLSRLVQRQFQLRPEGTAVLELPTGPAGLGGEPRSPFQLVTVPPAKPMAAYVPWGGPLMEAFRDGRARLYLMGAAFLVIAAGLVFDGGGWGLGGVGRGRRVGFRFGDGSPASGGSGFFGGFRAAAAAGGPGDAMSGSRAMA